MKNAIYHNARCSKSRATLALLEANGIELDIINYLETPPTTDELQEICQALGVAPTGIIRTKENQFTQLGLSLADDRSDRDWLELLVTNPILIERPIVCYKDKAVIGRPPENILTLVGNP